MIVTLTEILNEADKGKYGVGMFNAIDLQMAMAVIGAAEEANSPVILSTAEGLLKFGPLDELAVIYKELATKTKVPVCIHFDHGLTRENIIKAMRNGFSGVMYDCSSRPYEENIKECAEMAKIAHAFGAGIEAELGHVGSNDVDNPEASSDDHSVYTDPAQAAEFVERTGVDCLAVSVGNAHGVYLKEPKIDIPLVDQLRQSAGVPLVLHGGSGLSDDDFRGSIAKGICKVNIYTDLVLAANAAMRENFADPNGNIMSMNAPYIDAVKKATIKKMELFGSVNKA